LFSRAKKCIAEHRRCYDRHQALVQPEHEEQLLAQRRQGRDQLLLTRFLGLCPEAENYYHALSERRANPKFHAQKILALSEQYGTEPVVRALQDALAYSAFSCESIANLLSNAPAPRPNPAPSTSPAARTSWNWTYPPRSVLYQNPPTP
jgi:hypothetical protein